ncbi:hypothetical protein KKG41_06160, partial [Patescibacteria group bacterium]|nr:hypothetical protein [Patescibacteria group bacterium]MBU1890544.1 hypothetical protein [Patescibacteria group bacterium]
MAVAEVAKIGLIGLKGEQDKVVEALYDFSQVQIDNIAEGEINNEDLSKLEYQLAQLKFTLDFIIRHETPEKLSLRQKLANLGNQGLSVSNDDVARTIADFDFTEITKQAEETEAGLNLKQSQITNLKSEIDELEPWQDLSFNYQKTGSENINTKLGSIELAKLDKLILDINTKKLPVEVVKIAKDGREAKIVFVYLVSATSKVQELINEIELKEITLPLLDGTPKNTISNKRKEIEQNEKEIHELEKKANGLSQHKINLQIAFDYTTWQRDKKETLSKTKSQIRTFYLTGFVAKQRLKELENRLKEITENVSLTEIEIEPDEDIPVILTNNNAISPFESVTNIYGAPKSIELDPTPYLAPFFILFFGLCLSDAGYGILLAGLSFLAIKVMKIPRAKQGFYRLLIYAGISTIIIGALFGGWFGLNLDDMSQNVIAKALLSVKIIDPVSNPLTLLVFSLILGGVQVIVGIVINLYYQLKRNDKGKAFDSGVWLFFILGIVAWLVAGQVLKNEGLQMIAQYWLYAAVAAMVLTQGRRQKNVIMKIP